MLVEEPSEPAVLPIEDILDLHAFQPQELKELLDDYLVAAHEKGFREVRIIHGKGSGVLRGRVLSILKKHPLIMDVRQADASGGGWGATVAVLRSDEG
jgi:DNA-nicking Smr family endonuclease